MQKKIFFFKKLNVEFVKYALSMNKSCPNKQAKVFMYTAQDYRSISPRLKDCGYRPREE